MKRGADDSEWVETAHVEALYQERVTKDFPEAERRLLERILSFRSRGFIGVFYCARGSRASRQGNGKHRPVGLLCPTAGPGLWGQRAQAAGGQRPAGLLAEGYPATATGKEERRERCKNCFLPALRHGAQRHPVPVRLASPTTSWLPGDSSRQPPLDKIYRKVLPGALCIICVI